jgi:hypothetical protein
MVPSVLHTSTQGNELSVELVIAEILWVLSLKTILSMGES